TTYTLSRGASSAYLSTSPYVRLACLSIILNQKADVKVFFKKKQNCFLGAENIVFFAILLAF
ncbi:MAG: hypothetical protein J6R42_04975, partial [Clostridia bacterium]|nr:hypothetical protein [Clostridia bacterium]